MRVLFSVLVLLNNNESFMGLIAVDSVILLFILENNGNLFYCLWCIVMFLFQLSLPLPLLFSFIIRNVWIFFYYLQANPMAIHVTAALVQYKTKIGVEMKGVTTRYLSTKLPTESLKPTVPIYVSKACRVGLTSVNGSYSSHSMPTLGTVCRGIRY